MTMKRPGMKFASICFLLTALLLSACATTTSRQNPPATRTAQVQIPGAKKAVGPKKSTAKPVTPPAPVNPQTPGAPPPDVTHTQPLTPPPPQTRAQPALPHPSFNTLTDWQTTNLTPALKALRKSCTHWQRHADTDALKSGHDVFGRYADWREACQAASNVTPDAQSAKAFFEQYFRPVETPDLGGEGLLTGYFTPVIDVSHLATREMTEPILSLPEKEADRKKGRQFYTVTSSDVIAFGRPVDVFFMQVQGSGILKFPDGHMIRAAFAGHNDKPYTSIGKILIRRGELDKDRAAKQDIEAWMARAGFLKTKALINENDRYVFFKASPMTPGDGAIGSQGVPLVGMGSLAVDPRFYPYGVPIFLSGHFPQTGGDYKGRQEGHLLIAQDSGGAIKGRFRGDVYFGTGKTAGLKAGVMKHKARWTLLLPKA
ncbi:MAG TPA: hypothetical protein ENK01_03430, partial [Hellea balneolensis]|nr:hypothetical protein [Hellea balneolensis]